MHVKPILWGFFGTYIYFFVFNLNLTVMQKIGFVNALNSTRENSVSLQLVMEIHVEMVLHVFQSPGKMLFAFVRMEDLASSAVMVRTIFFMYWS